MKRLHLFSGSSNGGKGSSGLPSGRVRRYLAHVVLLLVALACSSDDPTGPALPSDVGEAGDGRLNATLEFIRSRYDLPALGAMLIHGDQIVETGAVGLRAVGFSESVTVDDRWHLGSLTKAMTATLAARLVERGDVSWDTTVDAVFPDLASGIRSEYRDVSLEDLLHHVTGLPAYVSATPPWPTLRTDARPLPLQRRRWTAEFLAMQPESPRGTYHYSNAGYVVAGAMLEEITGKPWEELMIQEVFTPLKMHSTGFGAPGSAGRRDQPWGHQDRGRHWRALEPGLDADNPAALGPAGTVHATLDDYARYIFAHLAGARGEPGLVSAESFAKLHRPAPGTDYALGWGVGDRNWAGGRVLQHSGSNTAWLAIVWLAPDRNFAGLAVCNAGGEEAIKGTDAAIQALINRFNAAFGGAN